MVVSVIALPQQASAAIDPACDKGSILGLPPWYKYLDVGPKDIKNSKGQSVGVDKCAIKGPLNDPSDEKSGLDWGKAGGKVGLAVVDILLRVGGMVAVAFVIYGGVRLTLSGGEPDKFKQAKDTVIHAMIGLVIVLVSTAAVNFVGSTLIK